MFIDRLIPWRVLTKFLVLGYGVFFCFAASWANPKTDISGALKYDCLHNATKSKGATQNCGQLSGLRFTYLHDNDSATQFGFSIDPFGSPSKSHENRIATDDSPLASLEDSSLKMLSDYRLLWKFRSRLTLGIVNFGGTTLFPQTHQMALGSRFLYSGWNQTALTAEYQLGSESQHRVLFAAGNGEGEPVRNLDPQQYGALGIIYRVIPGVFVKAAGSFDGNNFGSEASTWVYKNDPNTTKAGFSTQRVAFIVYTDGNWALAPGLLMSIGMQKNESKDLDKNINSIDPASYENNPNLTLGDLVIEDPAIGAKSANSVISEMMDVSLSYRILGSHAILANYETRAFDSGVSGQQAFFEDSNSSFHRKINQTGYGFGANLQLDKQLRAQLEYRTESYSKDLKKFNYVANNGKTSKSIDLFNARILYSW